MSIVKIKDKSFKTLSIPEAEILKKVQVVADRLNKDLCRQETCFLAVLNGAFIFAADLMRMITVPSEISFVKYLLLRRYLLYRQHEDPDGFEPGFAGRHLVIVGTS